MNYTNPPKAEWRNRVNNNCKSCIFDPAEAGTWRQQVTLCTVTSCHMWPIRPVSQDYIALMDADRGHHETTQKVISNAEAANDADGASEEDLAAKE